MLNLIICAIYVMGAVTAQPMMGPYETSQKKYDVAAMDSTNPSVWVWSPVTNQTDTQFPMISYLHGLFGKSFGVFFVLV